jgi:hypothetical protein
MERITSALLTKEKKMHGHQPIIEAYRQADADYRLSLFLENPCLRDTFIQIDQGEFESGKGQALQARFTTLRRMWKAIDFLAI